MVVNLYYITFQHVNDTVTVIFFGFNPYVVPDTNGMVDVAKLQLVGPRCKLLCNGRGRVVSLIVTLYLIIFLADQSDISSFRWQ